VRLPATGPTPTGLVLEHAKAENVAVTAPAGLTAGHGVRLVGGNTQFGRSSVTVPGLTGIETSGGPLVAATKITADVALMSTGGALTITHGNIESSRIGILSAGQLVLLDTLIHVSGGAGIEYGLLSTGETTVRHVTIAGAGAPTYGMRAYRQGGGTALQTLDNSTVTGFESDLSAGADGLSIARIEVKFSNYATKLVSPGGVIANAGDIMNFPPGFGDPAAGNFHLRHDSPLVDAGVVVGAGDTVPPVISRLRALPLRRLIRFRLSEAARVTIRLTRASRPRLVRSIRLSGRRGANAVRLRRRLVRALGPGRHRVKVSAQDAAGNLAKPRLARLRVRS
jgi:hypothetical protein